MSDSGSSPPPPPTETPPPPRSGCLTAFMVLVGIVMLLPGLCALIFGALSLGDSHLDGTVGSLILLGLLVGALGIIMIRAAIRGRRD